MEFSVQSFHNFTFELFKLDYIIFKRPLMNKTDMDRNNISNKKKYLWKGIHLIYC